MSYLRLLRVSDLRTIQNSYVQLFQLPSPSRQALEEALASSRWLCLAAMTPDSDPVNQVPGPSRQEYMGGFMMSVVASVGDFLADMDYYSQGEGRQDGGVQANAGPSGTGSGSGMGSGSGGGGGGGGGGVGVQATGLEGIGLPTAERAVNICLLGVLPSYRRRGLARLLLRQVVASARTANACSVFLHVRVANTAALSLYSSAGFVPTALVRDYYEGVDEDVGGTGTRMAATTSALEGGTASTTGPLTAGGDAVLLVLPLTETAAAAVAVAAAAAREVVAAAVASATAMAPAGGKAQLDNLPSTIVPRVQQQQQQQSDQPLSTRSPLGPVPLSSEGPGAAMRTAITRDSYNEPNSSSSSSGGSGNGIGSSSSSVGRGLIGLLAAAAAGAVDGLSVLLPGSSMGNKQQRMGAAGRQDEGTQVLQVGGEELMQLSGPDGEVYLQGPTSEAEEGEEPQRLSYPGKTPDGGCGKGRQGGELMTATAADVDAGARGPTSRYVCEQESVVARRSAADDEVQIDLVGVVGEGDGRGSSEESRQPVQSCRAWRGRASERVLGGCGGGGWQGRQQGEPVGGVSMTSSSVGLSAGIASVGAGLGASGCRGRGMLVGVVRRATVVRADAVGGGMGRAHGAAVRAGGGRLGPV